MYISNPLQRYAAVLALVLVSLSAASAQSTKKSKAAPAGKPVMWERVNIGQRDLFLGPGGVAMRPDVSRVTFIREEKTGFNKKYRIKDANGRVWVAKLGREARSETAAVRLLWALGYKTEINYLVPVITIPGKGTHRNVRLEARPDNIERLEEWKWKDNPFIGTNELQGLKVMMVLFNNWDIVDVQNKVLQVEGDEGTEIQYIVSDLGATFGRLGNNNLPIIYRLGRSIGKPAHYIKSKFIKGSKDGIVRLAYKGKNRDIFKNITIPQARWISDQLNQLSDQQIRDAFRAASFSPTEVETYGRAVKNKIGELDQIANERRLAIAK